jgi:hypothetical protein
MHDAVGGQVIGKMKMKAMGWAFGASMVLRVVSQYALGILWEWHFFWWFHVWTHMSTGSWGSLAIHVENWGWFIQFTPAFIGSGMLVGLNVAVSFFAGSVIAWGIIGPALVHNGAAFGKLRQPAEYGVMNFASFSPPFSSKETPSPRYWLLWPGVLAMIAISFTELLLQWRIIVFAFKAVGKGVAKGLYNLGRRSGRDIRVLRSTAEHETEDLIEDPAKPSEQVKMWMWAPGLLITIICMCVVMGVQYEMPVGMSLLSIFLAFFFSFLAIQCTGVTGMHRYCTTSTLWLKPQQISRHSQQLRKHRRSFSEVQQRANIGRSSMHRD